MKQSGGSLLILSLTLLGLVACAGVIPNQNQDHTPPMVITTLPVDLSDKLHPPPVISATFNESIAVRTLIPSNFRVSSNAMLIPGSIEYDASSQTVIFTPTTALSAKSQCQVTIGTGIRDLAGNALASTYVWSFNTDVP